MLSLNRKKIFYFYWFLSIYFDDNFFSSVRYMIILFICLLISYISIASMHVFTIVLAYKVNNLHNIKLN